MTFSLRELKAQAIERTQLSDFGDPWFELPLAAWVSDLQGHLLSERGRAFFTRLAVNNLCRRLEVIDCIARNPQIDEVEIPPILYVTGLERSGTTLLHNMLALHPKSRALLRWELMFPTPPPDTSTYATDPRIAKVQASIEPLRGSKLEHMHWVNADEPEECTWGAYDCTGLLGRAGSPLMPTWSKWLQDNDLTPSYREHRRLIKLLTWRHPVPAGGHLVLKCPQNSRSIEALTRVFPEAHLIFTHRDPYRAIVSACSLVDHITSSFSDATDGWRPGGPMLAAVVDGVEIALNNMLAADQAQGSGVTNVSYPTLVRNPLGVVQQIYRDAGVEVPTDLAARVSQFSAGQAHGKRAAPASDIGTYGLTQGGFRDRPAVSAYCSHFQVAAEATRITGT